MDKTDNNKKIKLNFTNGLVVTCLMKITQQVHSGKKVIVDIYQNVSGNRFTVGLNDNDYLSVWAIDSNENKIEVVLNDGPVVLNEYFFACFSLDPSIENELSIHIFNMDAKLVSSRTVKCKLEFKYEEQSLFVIGASYDKKDHAAFNLVNFQLFNRTLSLEEKKGLLISLLTSKDNTNE